MVSNSMINAALTARKTEKALVSAASASDLMLEVFNISMSESVPAPLYAERPKLPLSEHIKDLMVPRARPKYGRLHSPKVKSRGCDSTGDSGSPGNSRPGTSNNSKRSCAQGAVRNFLKERAEHATSGKSVSKGKRAVQMKEEQPEEIESPGEARRSTSFKNVAKAASTFGTRNSKLLKRGSVIDRSMPPETESTRISTILDESVTTGGEVLDGEDTIKLNRRRQTTHVSSEAHKKASKLLEMNSIEEGSRRQSSNTRDHEFEFKPKGTLDERLKRLDQKRNERAQQERSKLRAENKKRRFEELPDSERQALTDAFNKFDKDKSGYLDHAECVTCLREFGLNGTTTEEKRTVLSVCVEASVSDDDDPNPVPTVQRPCDVQIDLLDLALTVVPLVRQALTELRSNDLLKEFFRFDEDGSGKLNQKEIKEIARGMGLDPRSVELQDAKDEIVEIEFETFQEKIIRAREQQERTCRQKERHIQNIASLSEPAFKRFRKDLVPLYDVFVRYDKDKSGSLSKLELFFMLQESGLAPRSLQEKEDMRVIFNDFESSDSSSMASEEINLNDFLEIVWEIRRYRQDKIREKQWERFVKYDKDRSGALSIAEVSKVLADLHLTPANRVEQEQISNLIATVDEDGSGYIDFAEFQELSQRIDEKLRSFRYEEEIEFAMCLGFTEPAMRDLRQVFTNLDADASQKLDADEVRIGLAMMNKHVSHKVFEETFRALDEDSSGELDFLEFLRFMKMIVDQQGPMANQDEQQKLALRPKDLEKRILRRVLEYFRLAKHYVRSLSHNELIRLFCEYMCVKPEANLHTVLEVKTVGELYVLAQERDLAMQAETTS